jgi:hypothetical protein
MKPNHTKNGYMLVTVIGILTVLSLVFTMLFKITQQTVFNGKHTKSRTKAVAYAEAGIEFAYSVLRDNFDNRTNSASFRIDTGTTYTNGAPLTSVYGEGTFTLTVTPLGSQYVVINSLGACNTATAEAEVLVEDSNYTDWGKYEAFKKAIAAGGSGDFSGNGTVYSPIELDIHVNDKVIVNGNIDIDNINIASATEIDLKNKTLNGSATSPIISSSGTATDGKYVEAVPPIYIPTINLTPYYNKAVASGSFVTALTSEYKITSDITPAGGILYVDGDVKIYANVTGTVIATGNITIVSGGVKETGSGIALATETGDIVNRSTGESEGLVYSRTGSYYQNSVGTLTGQIIVGNDVSKTGGASLIFKESPPDYEYLGANPVISAWQK